MSGKSKQPEVVWEGTNLTDPHKPKKYIVRDRHNDRQFLDAISNLSILTFEYIEPDGIWRYKPILKSVWEQIEEEIEDQLR